MTTSASTVTCPVKKWRSWSQGSVRCGKPVKRDGLCGVHAAAKARREQNDRERERVYAEGWSMCPVNPDNSPIPHPVTYYEPVPETHVVLVDPNTPRDG